MVSPLRRFDRLTTSGAGGVPYPLVLSLSKGGGGTTVVVSPLRRFDRLTANEAGGVPYPLVLSL